MKKARNTLLRLTESEIERAEIVLATRNEIVDKLQRDAEKISNMKVDILSPLVDRVKAEHGLDAANKFRSAIEDELERALATLLDVKDKISTHVLRLTGDISSAPDISSIGNDDAVSDFDIASDAGLDDIAAQPVDDVPSDVPDIEPVPDERDMKESVNNKAFVVVVESVTNVVGKKYGPSEAVLKQWLTENSKKIRSIKEPIKRTGKK